MNPEAGNNDKDRVSQLCWAMAYAPAFGILFCLAFVGICTILSIGLVICIYEDCTASGTARHNESRHP